MADLIRDAKEQLANARCVICGWPLAESRDKGCVPGDCSYRPDSPEEQRRIQERRKSPPFDYTPILRAFVEMADKLQEHADFKPEIDPAEGDCDPWIRIAAHGKKMARALLDKLRSES